MEESSLVRFVFLLCLVSSSVFCMDDSDKNATASSGVYIVTLKDRSSVHFSGSVTGYSKQSLTATSSQIYRTLYVEKSYLSLFFFSLQSFILYPGFDFVSQNFVESLLIFPGGFGLFSISIVRHMLKFVNFGSQITYLLCFFGLFLKVSTDIKACLLNLCSKLKPLCC